jgi:hypothetical protein
MWRDTRSPRYVRGNGLSGSSASGASASCPGAGRRNTLEGEIGVDKKLVRELITDFYLLVVSRLPKAEQPVAPHTYGTSTRAAR